MQLSFRKYGQGIPLVILHGLFGASDNWVTVSTRLSQQFGVFALDLRNHGTSPHHPDMSYDSLADDLEHFLEDQGLKTAFLLGHSMGGKVAMRFSFLRPSRVRGLVVVDIAPRPYAPSHTYILDALNSLNIAGLKTRQEAFSALASSIPDAAVRQFLLKNMDRDSSGNLTWRIGLQEITGQYERIIGDIGAGEFSGPCLFIKGGLSDYILEADAQLIKSHFPTAELQAIGNAGHWVHAEAPDEFCSRVLNFLVRHVQGGL